MVRVKAVYEFPSGLVLIKFKVFVDFVRFRLAISAIPTNPPPKGYLFVCPTEDLQCASLSFRSLDCLAYWSFDSSGTERLSTVEASGIGFPSIEITMEAWGRNWDERVYAGLRTFHQAEGFDPDNQDVALHLGHPLYQLSTGAPFAHGESQSSLIICADVPKSTKSRQKMTGTSQPFVTRGMPSIRSTKNRVS
jgi:hypothetical protein